MRAIALIDGEHYPDVVRDTLAQLGDRFEFVAAVMLGGTEKLRLDAGVSGEALYGVPVVAASDPAEAIDAAIDAYIPETLVDLSDEPVVGYRERFRYISQALCRNVSYEGSDFRFSSPSYARLSSCPSLAIIGTAKRVGKTAVSGFAARALSRVFPGTQERPGVVVVSMGRGGPATPRVIDGAASTLSVQDLLALSRDGEHAASDCFEDAALSRVMTVGCRRCGGGMAGRPFVSNVAEGAEVANELEPDLVIFEGSGAALPPVEVDVRLLVAGAHQPEAYLTGYLGSYRVLSSDAVILTMAEEPLADADAVRSLCRGIEELKPGIPVLPVVFRPRPADPIEGKTAAFFSTAPAVQERVLRRHLEEEYGCRVALFSSGLSDRTELRRDFAAVEMQEVDVVLTEIKAAAIDIVAEEAERRNLPVVFVDNEPEVVGQSAGDGLESVCIELAEAARERFRANE